MNKSVISVLLVYQVYSSVRHGIQHRTAAKQPTYIPTVEYVDEAGVLPPLDVVVDA